MLVFRVTTGEQSQGSRFHFSQWAGLNSAAAAAGAGVCNTMRFRPWREGRHGVAQRGGVHLLLKKSGPQDRVGLEWGDFGGPSPLSLLSCIFVNEMPSFSWWQHNLVVISKDSVLRQLELKFGTIHQCYNLGQDTYPFWASLAPSANEADTSNIHLVGLLWR